MTSNQLRTILTKAMLACLVGAALVAVVAILAGSFGEIAWKALGTVFSAMIHIGILFIVLTVASDNEASPSRSSSIVINSTLAIVMLSFFTSIFGTWGVFDGELATKFYLTYAVALFVILHAKTLVDIFSINKKVAYYIYANYAFMGLVALMIIGLVWTNLDIIDGFYGRLLGAAAVIDVTLSMIIAVMHRLHLQKNPELLQVKTHQTHSVLRLSVALILFVFFVYPLLSLLFFFS